MCGKIHYMRFREHRNQNRPDDSKISLQLVGAKEINVFGMFLLLLENVKHCSSVKYDASGKTFQLTGSFLLKKDNDGS